MRYKTLVYNMKYTWPKYEIYNVNPNMKCTRPIYEVLKLSPKMK